MKLQGFLSQVGLGGRVSEGQQLSKQPVELAKKFKVALQEKKPAELGSILGQAKALGVKAEKAFLKSALSEGTAASLKDVVLAKLSAGQKAELAKALFAQKRHQAEGTREAMEAKLGHFLAGIGQEKSPGTPAKDEMVREPAKPDHAKALEWDRSQMCKAPERDSLAVHELMRQLEAKGPREG